MHNTKCRGKMAAKDGMGGEPMRAMIVFDTVIVLRTVD